MFGEYVNLFISCINHYPFFGVTISRISWDWWKTGEKNAAGIAVF